MVDFSPVCKESKFLFSPRESHRKEIYFAITSTSCSLLYKLLLEFLGPVVQSIVSLTSSIRGQLVKYFTTLLLNTLNFFVEKMREAFALQKLLTLFQQKILENLDINV